MGTDMEDVMLSTFDNPFNPYTEFIAWWKYDLMLGHDCCGTLARESNVNDLASDAVNSDAILSAMQTIVKREPTIYRIVHPTDYALA